MKSSAAAWSSCHWRLMNAIITANRATIIASAASMRWKEKKIGDQQKLRAICTAQSFVAEPRGSLSNVRNPAIAIIRKRTVQTGAKTQSGGLNGGLFSAAYHAPGVFRAPIASPVAGTSRTKAAKRNDLPRRNAAALCSTARAGCPIVRSPFAARPGSRSRHLHRPAMSPSRCPRSSASLTSSAALPDS